MNNDGNAISCKPARGGSTSAGAKPKRKAAKVPKVSDKFKGKKVLCRVKEPADEWGGGGIDKYIIYRDGTWRFDSGEDLLEWDIAYSEKAGPVFMYRETINHDGDKTWTTDFSGDSAVEVLLAKSIVKALGELAVEDMLKGKFDEKTSESS